MNVAYCQWIKCTKLNGRFCTYHDTTATKVPTWALCHGKTQESIRKATGIKLPEVE